VTLAFDVSGWFMASYLKGNDGEKSEGSGGYFLIYCLWGLCSSRVLFCARHSLYFREFGSTGGGAAANAT
jgi:hypothetical protein